MNAEISLAGCGRLLLALVLIGGLGCAGSTPKPSRPSAPGPAHPAPPPASPPRAPVQVPPTIQPEASPPPPERAPRSLPEGPILLKVGLATDLPSVTLPCCASAITAQVGDQVVATVAPLQVEPAASGARQGFYRLQVAALRDERQAQGLAQKLSQEMGQPGEAYFDAGIDLYRVRIGHYDTREEAERDLRRLSTLGVTNAFVANEGSDVSEPALRVTQGDRTQVLPGRWLSVSPSGDGGIQVQGKRYRGRLLVYLNDRGTLNLINELPVEQYLRGVVPSEMGPEQYKQLEALKAQAVAARTYALANLGEFSREGYDICATPRCQVYNGMTVEHPFSDRAIAETDGQVLLYKGDLIDALYSSTCGGHTEDAQVIFPLKTDEPYLKAVPCMEEGVAMLDGDLPPGVEFPTGLTRRLFPPAAGVSPVQALAARFEHLALLAGLPAPGVPLGGLDRRQVQRYVTAAFDLGLDARLLVSPQDVNYLLHDPPPDWTAEDLRRAAYFVKSGLIGGPLDQPLSEAEVERLLLALGELLQVVRREEVSYLSLAAGVLSVKGENGPVGHPLPADHFATFRRRGEELKSASLALLPGDKLTLFWQGDRLMGALQQVDLEGVAFDRSSRYSSWTRYRSDSQIATQVAARFPGLGFHDFTVVERGPSGRVGKIRLAGDGEKTMDVEGIAIRWTLDVPDTLFTVKRLTPQGQEAGWLFNGRGWGHGVGMCQVGAYGMAQRGRTYRDILTHYYSGVELGRVRLRAAGAADGAAAGGRR